MKDIDVFDVESFAQIMSEREREGVKEIAASLNIVDILPFALKSKRYIERTIKQEDTIKVFITANGKESLAYTYFITESNKFDPEKWLKIPPLKTGFKIYAYLVNKLKKEGKRNKKGEAFVVVSLKELRKAFNLKVMEVKRILLEMDAVSVRVTKEITNLQGVRITQTIIQDAHLIKIHTAEEAKIKGNEAYVMVIFNPLFLAIFGKNPNIWIRKELVDSLSPTALALLMQIKRFSKKRVFTMKLKDIMLKLGLIDKQRHGSRNKKLLLDAFKELQERRAITSFKVKNNMVVVEK